MGGRSRRHKDAETLRQWLAATMADGGGFADAVFFVHAFRAVDAGDDVALRTVAELAAAFVPSKERFLETTAQGRAFLEVTRAAWPCSALDRLAAAWDGPVALPVAVGTTCAGHGIGCAPALNAFLHAIAANWISAGVRLIPLGQTDGQRVLAALEKVVAATAARRSQRRSTRSALVRFAPISPACATRLNTRDCSGAEEYDDERQRSLARRRRRPGRIGQDRADGRFVQASARTLRNRRHHQRHLHQMGRRISGALRRARPDRIAGVETGGCPHTAIREDASANLAAIADMRAKFPDLDLVLIESGGDNLAATFSPELADLTIYVINVAAGDKIPSKGGPGITRSDLLVINKIDLAPYVGASLETMERESKRMRGARPFIFPICAPAKASRRSRASSRRRAD